MAITIFQNDLQSIVDRFVSQYTSRASNTIRRQDGSLREEIGLYSQMCRRDPILRFAIELVFLYCYSLIGEYEHPKARVQRFVRDSLVGCRGAWPVKLKEMMSFVWFGHSWTEVSFKDDQMGRKTIDRLRTLNPTRYDFWGREDEINTVYYRGVNSAVELDFNTGLHFVSGTDLSFDDVYGAGRLEACYPYWELETLIMPILAVASQRQATPILVKKTETGESVVQINPDTGEPVMKDGEPVLINKGWDAVQQLSALGTAGVTAIDPDDELFQIEPQISDQFLAKTIEFCEQRRLIAALTPSTLFTISGTGVGDSGLSERHQQIFETVNAGLTLNFVEELVEQLIRPMVEYNFGAQSDYGYFPIKRTDDNATMVATIISEALAMGAFSKNDFEVANALRTRLGMGELALADFERMRAEDAETASLDAPPMGI